MEPARRAFSITTFAGAHQRFLVGESDRAPCGDRGEGRTQPRGADDRRNHQIGLAQSRFLDRLRAGGDFDRMAR